MEPTPAKANQREGEGPGRGRHHLGQGRKSHLASTLPPGSSVPRFFISFVATCHRVGPNDQFLEGKRRFREFGPRIWQKHQWSRLEAQPGVHMCPNCGHMTWLCSLGISAAITLEQAFHFRTERKRKGDNPARRCALGRLPSALLSAPGPRGAWALTPQLSSVTLVKAFEGENR